MHLHKFIIAALIITTLTHGCGSSSEPVPFVEGLKPSLKHLRVHSIIRTWSDSSDIEWETAITLGELSNLAYQDAPTRRRMLTELGFGEITLLDANSQSGFIALADDVAVVAFRGTDEAVDWIANLDFRQLSSMGNERAIHTGFQDAYNVFAAQVVEQICSRKIKHLWITGHSLGGAMAACCAYDLVQQGVPFTGVVTFGQPRIGNAALATYLSEQTGDRYVRFINEGDPVPLLPPCIGFKLPAYQHAGRQAWFYWDQFVTTAGPTQDETMGPAQTMAQSTATDSTYPEMTEEDILALQQRLKEDQANNTASSPPTSNSLSPQLPTPPDRGFFGNLKNLFYDRIREHEIDQYRRKLNAFRQ